MINRTASFREESCPGDGFTFSDITAPPLCCREIKEDGAASTLQESATKIIAPIDLNIPTRKYNYVDFFFSFSIYSKI